MKDRDMAAHERSTVCSAPVLQRNAILKAYVERANAGTLKAEDVTGMSDLYCTTARLLTELQGGIYVAGGFTMHERDSLPAEVVNVVNILMSREPAACYG